jgi:hypothetical protein
MGSNSLVYSPDRGIEAIIKFGWILVVLESELSRVFKIDQLDFQVGPGSVHYYSRTSAMWNMIHGVTVPGTRFLMKLRNRIRHLSGSPGAGPSAPVWVYDKAWARIGIKQELAGVLEGITGIRAVCLLETMTSGGLSSHRK